jgi:hypothetical protein
MKWEYLVAERSMSESADAIEKLLNTLGRNGWELVSIAPMRAEPDYERVRMVFKRPISN